jgi:hypothetical protein
MACDKIIKVDFWVVRGEKLERGAIIGSVPRNTEHSFQNKTKKPFLILNNYYFYYHASIYLYLKIIDICKHGKIMPCSAINIERLVSIPCSAEHSSKD